MTLCQGWLTPIDVTPRTTGSATKNTLYTKPIACSVLETRIRFPSILPRRGSVPPPTPSCSPSPVNFRSRRSSSRTLEKENVVKRWSSIIERWTHEVYRSLSVSRSLFLSPGRRHRCRRHGRMYLEGYHVERRVRIHRKLMSVKKKFVCVIILVSVILIFSFFGEGRKNEEEYTVYGQSVCIGLVIRRWRHLARCPSSDVETRQIRHSWNS